MNQIKERPILFSAQMVLAIPDRKSQTRRAFSDRITEIMHSAYLLGEISDFINNGELATHDLAYVLDFCPYGKPGDRLWVKETYFAWGRWETRFSEKKGRDEWHFIDMTIECGLAYLYAADNPGIPPSKGRGALPSWHKRPAIFMPRIASRITLEIVGVRVELLNNITEQDAIAEGIELVGGPASVSPWRNYRKGEPGEMNLHCSSPQRSFMTLWESINGAGSWAANPWVWAVEFKRVST